MNPRTPTGPDPQSGAFDLAWRPPLSIRKFYFITSIYKPYAEKYIYELLNYTILRAEVA
ncbi:protein of unknown function [Methanocaldococcus lauensis]|nr:protein of unknown function [Methanocaldococcus lauensis]